MTAISRDRWENGDGLVPLHRTDDPRRWLDLTYADDSMIIQVDNGHPAGPGLIGEAPSSSASCPSIVAVMLAALDAQEGHRVLEIGTGSLEHALLRPSQPQVPVDAPPSCLRPGRTRRLREAGRLDLGGPPMTAWELAQAWPDAELHLVNTGHTGGPDMTAHLIVATDRFAEHSRP